MRDKQLSRTSCGTWALTREPQRTHKQAGSAVQTAHISITCSNKSNVQASSDNLVDLRHHRASEWVPKVFLKRITLLIPRAI